MISFKKIITSITLFFVLLGPLGVQPSQALVPLALINPVTLGVCVAAAGVIAAGTAYYAPAVYQAGQTAADTATGALSSSLIGVKAIAVAGSQYLYGKGVQAEIAYQAASDYITANASTMPILSSILSSATGAYPQLAPGDIIKDMSTGTNYLTGVPTVTPFYSVLIPYNPNFPDPRVEGFLPYNTPTPNRFYQDVKESCTATHCTWKRYEYPISPTLVIPSVDRGPVNVPQFAAGVNSNSSAAKNDEINRIFADNPDAVIVPGITPEETANAYDQVETLLAQDFADTMQAGAVSNPDLTPSEIAALQAVQAANLTQLAEQQALEEQPDILFPQLDEVIKQLVEANREFDVSREAHVKMLEDDTLPPESGGDALTALADQHDQDMTEKVDLLKTEINAIQETAFLDDGLFDGFLNKLTPVIQAGECQPFTQEIHAGPITREITISCEASAKFKAIMGFLVALYTIMELMDILFTGITPKGSVQLQLFK